MEPAIVRHVGALPAPHKLKGKKVLHFLSILSMVILTMAPLWPVRRCRSLGWSCPCLPSCDGRQRLDQGYPFGFIKIWPSEVEPTTHINPRFFFSEINQKTLENWEPCLFVETPLSFILSLF
jgi:hypothetical protein